MKIFIIVVFSLVKDMAKIDKQDSLTISDHSGQFNVAIVSFVVSTLQYAFYYVHIQYVLSLGALLC